VHCYSTHPINEKQGDGTEKHGDCNQLYHESVTGSCDESKRYRCGAVPVHTSYRRRVTWKTSRVEYKWYLTRHIHKSYRKQAKSNKSYRRQVKSNTSHIQDKSYWRQVKSNTSQIEDMWIRRQDISKTSHIEDKLYQIQVVSNKSYRTRHIERVHACKPGNRLTLRHCSKGKAGRGGVAGPIAVDIGRRGMVVGAEAAEEGEGEEGWLRRLGICWALTILDTHRTPANCALSLLRSTVRKIRVDDEAMGCQHWKGPLDIRPFYIVPVFVGLFWERDLSFQGSFKVLPSHGRMLSNWLYTQWGK